MKRFPLLFTILLSGALALGQDNNETTDLKPVDGSMIEQREDGLNYLKGGTEPFTGSFNSYHVKGVKASEGHYLNGKAHGLHSAWRKNGLKSVELTFDEGKIDGDFLQWYPSGKLMKKSVYKQDVPLSYLAWHENGEKMEERIYKDGEQTLVKGYHEDGSKKEIKHFRGGGVLIGTYTRWYRNGQKEIEAEFKDGVQHGPSASWYESGNKSTEANFVEGEQHGLVLNFSEKEVTTAIKSYSQGGMDYPQTIRLMEQLIEKNQKNLKSTDDDLLQTYWVFSSILTNYGNPLRALKYHDKILTAYNNEEKSAVEGGLFALANAYENKALLLSQLADHREALHLQEKVLALRLQKLDPNDPTVAQSYSNVALSHLYLTQYGKAIEFGQKAISIYEKNLEGLQFVLGKDSEYRQNRNGLAVICLNIAPVYSELGQREKQFALLEKALAILEEGHGDSFLASGYANVGSFHGESGDYEKALEYHQKALEIRLKLYGPDHPLVATAHANIGSNHEPLNNFEKAKLHYEKALDIRLKTLGDEHPDVASSYRALASLCSSSGGDFEGALEYERKALAINRKALKVTDSTLGLNLGAICELLIYLDRPVEAMEIAREYNSVTNAQLSNVLSFATHEERLNYRVSSRDVFRFAASLGMAPELTDMILANKGIVLASILEDQWLSMDHGDPEISGLASELKAASKRFNSLEKIPAGIRFDETGLPIARAIDLARSKVEELQRKLSENTTRYGTARASLSVTAQQLKERIPKNAVLLEFIHYYQFTKASGLLGVSLEESPMGIEIKQLSKDMPALKAGMEVGDVIRSINGKKSFMSMEGFTKQVRHYGPGENIDVSVSRAGKELHFQITLAPRPPLDSTDLIPSYGATVLDKLGEPSWVPLGPADVIEEAVERYRLLNRGTVRETRLESFNEVNAELGRLLFTPIEKKLPKGTKTLIVSPDGALNFVSFAALQGAGGKFLAERFGFRYVASGRDLVFGPKATNPGNEIVIFANPDFDQSEKPIAKEEKPEAFAMRSIDWKKLMKVRVPPLPGTEKEAIALRGLAEERKAPTKVYLGSDATEERLAATASPHILHVATHGYFLVDPEMKNPFEALPSGPTDRVRDLPRPPKKPKILNNPMDRSFLAFSGAKKTFEAWGEEKFPPPGSDGILTAREAGMLDLDGTWLVTLSACDTGSGNATSGEGVMGLRRGFVKAGARNLLFTLWPTDDKTSADLMTDFYNRALANGDAPGTLEQVQLEWLLRLRKEWTPKLGEEAAAGLAARLAGPFVLSFQDAPE